jgi:hypothetical protein
MNNITLPPAQSLLVCHRLTGFYILREFYEGSYYCYQWDDNNRIPIYLDWERHGMVDMLKTGGADSEDPSAASSWEMK